MIQVTLPDNTLAAVPTAHYCPTCEQRIVQVARLFADGSSVTLRWTEWCGCVERASAGAPKLLP